MERDIGVELRRISNLTCRYYEQQSNKKLVEAITGTNGWIIGYIARKEKEGEAVYQRDLEKHFGITRSTASKVVNLMVQKGLVEQRPVPEDKRLRRLMLTERAREVKQLMDEDHQRLEQTLRRGFSDDDMSTLFSLLDRLKENLEQTDESEEPSKA